MTRYIKGYMKILICLILLAGVLADLRGKFGLIVNYHLPELADDMLFLFKTLLRNVKSYDHKDILQVIKHRIFTEERAVEEIEAVDMFFNATEFYKSHSFNNSRNSLEMNSNRPILKFTYKFNWRAGYPGFYEKSGTGLFTATSEKLSAAAFLENGRLSSEVNAGFKFEMVKLDDDNISNDVKDWINKVLKDNITRGLDEAFNSNKDFISKYLFAKYRTLSNNYRGAQLIFESIPVRWESTALRIVTVFETKIMLNNKIHTLDTAIKYIQSTQKDITMIVNSEFIFKAIYAMYADDQFGTPVDLKEFGYSGMIEDFYKIDPNLRVRYPRNAKVQVNSVALSFNYSMLLLGLYPTVAFRFFATDKVGSLNEFANVTANLTIKLEKTIADDKEQLFGAKITEVAFGLPAFYPPNIETWEFMEILLSKVFDKTLPKKILELPRLRYEPTRNYKKMDVTSTSEGFVTIYTF